MSVQRSNDTSGHPTVARKGEENYSRLNDALQSAQAASVTTRKNEDAVRSEESSNDYTSEFTSDFKKILLPCGALILIFFAVAASGIFGGMGLIIMDMLSSIVFFVLVAFVIFYKKRINKHSRPNGFTQKHGKKNKKI